MLYSILTYYIRVKWLIEQNFGNFLSGIDWLVGLLWFAIVFIPHTNKHLIREEKICYKEGEVILIKGYKAT